MRSARPEKGRLLLTSRPKGQETHCQWKGKGVQQSPPKRPKGLVRKVKNHRRTGDFQPGSFCQTEKRSLKKRTAESVRRNT